jgi:MATE family multidrug resistance protein
LAIAEGLIMGLVLICVRYVWGHAYSDVEEVVTYVAQMMLIISVSNFFDGIQCVLSGTDGQHLLATLPDYICYRHACI